MMGSVADKVVRAAPCPVLTGHLHDCEAATKAASGVTPAPARFYVAAVRR